MLARYSSGLKNIQCPAPSINFTGSGRDVGVHYGISSRGNCLQYS